MGDRANIVVRDDWPADLGDKEGVSLYTHWGGEELPETLRLGLSAGRSSWDDPQYLARVLFQTMIGPDTGHTGYGISSRLGDNDHDLIVLKDERVYLLPESVYLDEGFASLDEGFASLAEAPSASFDEVCDYDSNEMTWEILSALVSKVAS